MGISVIFAGFPFWKGNAAIRLFRIEKQEKQMKKILLPLLAGVSMLLAFVPAKAQTGKLGHFNSTELMQMMPEMDSAQRKQQDYAKELQDLIVGMQTELQNKYTEFQNNQSQWSDLIKQTKSREIQDMQTRVQEFMQQSEEDYQAKTQELLAPIIDKVTKAVTEVAKEGKFAYIFDASNNALFMGNEAIDVMPLVKKKLGLPDVPVTQGIPQGGK